MEENQKETMNQEENEQSEQEAVETIEQSDNRVEAGQNTEESLSDRESELLQQVEQLKQESEENYNRYLRAQADFDNYRRRTMKEKEESAKYASMKVIEALLPVLDNFERAIAAGEEKSDNGALLEGVQMVFRQIVQVMEQEEVKPIDAVGKPFDPNYHQAVMQVESDDYESGTVVEELQKGYIMKDRVIRPSMVKVSS